MKCLLSNRLQGAGFRACASLLASDLRQLQFQSRKRTYLSCLSAPHHGGLRRQQARQTAQIDRQHRQREYVADLKPTTQLHLPYRAAVLFAIAEQRLDHLANDLAGGVARMPRGASIDAALAPGAFATLGVVLKGILRHVRGDAELAASGHETGSIEVLVGADALALLSRQSAQHRERRLM